MNSLTNAVVRLLIGLAGAGVALGQDPAAEADRLYRSASGLLNRGLNDMAAAEYEKFIAGHPRHEKIDLARYGLAVCRFKAARLADAEPLLDAIEAKDDFPFAAEVGVMLGQCRLAAGNPAEAVKALAGVVRKRGKHELVDDAVALLCEALHADAKHAEAANIAEQFCKNWPDSPLRERVDFVRALADVARGEFEPASRRLEAYLEMYPKSESRTRAALLAGQCHQRGERLDEAAMRFREVIARPEDPLAAEALYGLAGVLVKKGERAAAADSLDTLLVKHAAHALADDAKLLRAQVHFDANEFDKALALLDPLEKAGGERGQEAAYFAAKCRLRQNDAAGATQSLTRLAAGTSARPEILYDLAVARLRAGEIDAALEALTQFRSTHADHELAAEALYLSASALHRGRKFDDSRSLCREFLERHARHERAAAVLFLAAENDFLADRMAEALDGYRRLLKKFPSDAVAPKAELRVALALCRLEKFDEAEPRLAGVVKAGVRDDATRAAWLALADIYVQRGEWKQAEPLLREYLDAPAPPASADDAWLKLGLCKLRQDAPQEALAALDTLLTKFADSPHRVQALFEKGQALVALTSDEPAREAFERVLAEGKDSRFAPFAQQHLAGIASRKGDFKSAAERYQLVADSKVEGGPAGDALLRRGESLLALGDYAAAEKALIAFLDAGGGKRDAARARAALAISVARQDRYEDAVRLIESRDFAAGELDATLRRSVQQELAWCLRKLGRSDDAAGVYRAMLKEPSGAANHAAMLDLAELDAAAGRTDEALAALRRLREAAAADAKAVPPDVLEAALYRLGVCEQKAERHAQAADALEELLRTFATSKLAASASYFCGDAHLRVGAATKALPHLERVVEKFTSDAVFEPSLLRLGECLAQLQRWPASERSFADYLEKFGTSEQAYQAQFGLGWARENQQRYDEAISAYRLVVEKQRGPTAARAQFQIGECLLARKQYEEAARELLKVDILFAYPEWSAAALYEAGRCFEQLGKPAEARAQFQAVLEKQVESKWAELARKRMSELRDGRLPGRESSK
jgi:TolA-binding protein